MRRDDSYKASIKHSEEIPGVTYYDRFLYSEKCDKCGKVHNLKTQGDDMPEYYTSVVIICDCGTDIHFELPVN